MTKLNVHKCMIRLLSHKPIKDKKNCIVRSVQMLNVILVKILANVLEIHHF